MAQAKAGDAPRSTERFSGILQSAGHWTVALTSLGLAAGLVMWGHDTMTREVHGVPVVRAHAEQMRIAPTEPAGEGALYRELTVGRIAEGNGVAPPPETVRVAATGTDLSTDDFVSRAAAEAAAEPEAGPTEEAPRVPLMGAMVAVQPIPAGVPGVAASPRPIARPAVAVAAARAVATMATASAGSEIDPASVAVGAPVAQLGAFPDAGSARAAWAGLAARHESLLAERDRMVIEVPVAGRVLWRLRVAGFGSREDAVRFCSALATAGSECIPTVHG